MKLIRIYALYAIISAYCRKDKGVGGVSFYIHSKHKMTKLVFNQVIRINIAESLFVTIKSRHNCYLHKLIICIIYRPPQSSTQDFCEGFSVMMDEIIRRGFPIYMQYT